MEAAEAVATFLVCVCFDVLGWYEQEEKPWRTIWKKPDLVISGGVKSFSQPALSEPQALPNGGFRGHKRFLLRDLQGEEGGCYLQWRHVPVALAR